MFVKEEDDDIAYRLTRAIRHDVSSKAKEFARNVIGEKGVNGIKKY